eukprot:8908416-Pyramimonas_sp.AAC.2
MAIAGGKTRKPNSLISQRGIARILASSGFPGGALWPPGAVLELSWGLFEHRGNHLEASRDILGHRGGHLGLPHALPGSS